MLPKIEQPYFNTILPISGTPVRYRPYLMKEQKIILLSKDAEDKQEQIESVIQVLEACTNKLEDIRDLNSIDIAFLMTKIRSASEGSIIDLTISCVKCDHSTPVHVDLETMVLSKEFDSSKTKIMLSEDVGVQLKIPDINILALSQDNPDIFMLLPTIIDSIFDKDQVYKSKDIPEAELDEFIENLSSKNVTDMADFFNDVPTLKVDIPFTCEACGHEEIVSEENIQNFLA